MKRLNVVWTIVVVVCLASFCSGQEGKGKAKPLPQNQQHLKPIQYFIGDWQLTGEIELVGQPKQPFVFVRQFKWDLGRTFVQATMTETKDGKTELRHRSMIGWDSKSQSIKEWGFWNSDLPTDNPSWAETVTWLKDGKKWRIEIENAKGLFTIIDKNTHTYECQFRGEDGSDNSWHFTAKRKPAAVSSGYEHLKDMEDFIGNWVGEETLVQDIPGFAKEGEKVMHRPSLRWVLDKAAVQMDALTTTARGESIKGRWLFGWDAIDGDIWVSGAHSGGARYWGTLKKESPNKWMWRIESSSSDGKHGSSTCAVTMLENNSVHVHEFTHVMFDGKSRPDYKVVYKRAE